MDDFNTRLIKVQSNLTSQNKHLMYLLGSQSQDVLTAIGTLGYPPTHTGTMSAEEFARMFFPGVDPALRKVIRDATIMRGFTPFVIMGYAYPYGNDMVHHWLAWGQESKDLYVDETPFRALAQASSRKFTNDIWHEAGVPRFRLSQALYRALELFDVHTPGFVFRVITPRRIA